MLANTDSYEAWNGGDGGGVHEHTQFGAWCNLCRERCLPERLCLCCAWQDIDSLERQLKKLKTRKGARR